MSRDFGFYHLMDLPLLSAALALAIDLRFEVPKTHSVLAMGVEENGRIAMRGAGWRKYKATIKILLKEEAEIEAKIITETRQRTLGIKRLLAARA